MNWSTDSLRGRREDAKRTAILTGSGGLGDSDPPPHPPSLSVSRRDSLGPSGETRVSLSASGVGLEVVEGLVSVLGVLDGLGPDVTPLTFGPRRRTTSRE